MLSFEAEGVCPRQFSECRMVVLAKPNKVTQGCTAAADTRPISIFSCFYRTWLTCMRKWLQTHMPSQVCIGQGSEAQPTAGLLLNSISEKGFGATLDYSKCYDSMDPRGTLALMQLAGLPATLCAFCRAVWTTQVRHVEWAGCAHPEALRAHTATAQGCPLGPLALRLSKVLGLQDGSKRFRAQVPKRRWGQEFRD